MECSYTIRNELKFIIKINDKWNIFTCKHLLEMHEYDIFFRPIKWIIIESSLFFLTYMYVYIFNHFLLENKTKKKPQTHLLSTVSSLHNNVQPSVQTLPVSIQYTPILATYLLLYVFVWIFSVFYVLFFYLQTLEVSGGGGIFHIYAFFRCLVTNPLDIRKHRCRIHHSFFVFTQKHVNSALNLIFIQS